MEFTGERAIPGQTDPDLMNEHWARYAFAEALVGSKRVLDAGCGVGYGAARLAEVAAEVVALDQARDPLTAGGKQYSHPRLRFVQGDCTRFPFADSSLDAVVAFEVIEHLDDWQALISESARVLAPHGQLLVSTPNRIYSQESRQEPNLFHVHEFEYSEFESELGKFFPHILLFLENHSDAITFIPPLVEGVRTLLGNLKRDSVGAHFFLAVCSKQPQYGSPAFVFVPSGGNVLREREQHVNSLQKQVHEGQIHLTEAQRALDHMEQEIVERTRWAKELNADLESVREDRRKLIKRLDEVEQRVIERSEWAISLDRELKETQQHLNHIKSAVAFRVCRRAGLILDSKFENESTP